MLEDPSAPSPAPVSPALRTLLARRAPLAAPTEQLALLDGLDVPTFDSMVATANADLTPTSLEYFQINVGKLCNMTCRHCHVDAGPDRTDAMMSDEVMQACLDALDQTTAHTVDITGGAPELHPRFRWLVEQVRARGRHVIDRCNLTVLLLPRSHDLIEFLARNEVEVVCSLPHYRARNTDAQRGDGTFERSIAALRLLNQAGYGLGVPERRLTLVSNPSGAFLGGNQAALDGQWKARLQSDFGIRFDRLFVLNNMPISRFLEWLVESGNLETYMQRLVEAFNPDAVGGVMCRNTVSVGYDGRVFDCDFNQMLDLGLTNAHHQPLTVQNFDPGHFGRRSIVTRAHCFGCTAGAGSSCGGATA